MKPVISQPCPLQWDSLTPSGEGRYCSSCEKVVIDFAGMSDQEMKDYFTKQITTHACGSFYKHQVAGEQTGKLEGMALGWLQKAESGIKSRLPRMAAVLAIGALLTAMGCRHRRTMGAYVSSHTNVRYIDEPGPATAQVNTDSLRTGK